jgi:hypothetical protein
LGPLPEEEASVPEVAGELSTDEAEPAEGVEWTSAEEPEPPKDGVEGTGVGPPLGYPPVWELTGAEGVTSWELPGTMPEGTVASEVTDTTDEGRDDEAGPVVAGTAHDSGMEVMTVLTVTVTVFSVALTVRNEQCSRRDSIVDSVLHTNSAEAKAKANGEELDHGVHPD